jgi:hypothetical protein
MLRTSVSPTLLIYSLPNLREELMKTALGNTINEKEERRPTNTFYILIWKATHCHSCHTAFVRRKSLSTAYTF